MKQIKNNMFKGFKMLEKGMKFCDHYQTFWGKDIRVCRELNLNGLEFILERELTYLKR